ncbi:MAG: leucine-rich repeat domain-containing protein [Flavobacteriales bacterium]|nr:leucine-rich repeat domain-containing protein [Flavobacteriales bacterium]
MLFKTFYISLFLIISVGAFGQLLTKEQLDTCRTYKSLESALKHPDKVYKLKLERLKLKEFPEAILTFKNLQILSLSKNKIKEIPEAISQLKYLQEVDFGKNKVVEFPEGLTQCIHLRKLVFSQNLLQALPAKIGDLKNLEYLDLWSNDLGIYPDEMSQLTSLKELDLRVINLNQTEQNRIKRLLPKVKIHFSPSCDCAN